MSAFAEVTLAQYALVAAVSFAASILGGVAGYGTGLLLPPVLVPIIGAEAVVPVISVASLLTNFSRLAAFRSELDLRKAVLIACFAFPPCLLGAWGYTRLSGPAVSALLGTVLVLLVPGRRLLARLRGHLKAPGIAVGATGFGLLFGGTAGTGIVLLSILLAAGLPGRAVIATDAGISVVLAFAKIGVFQGAGALGPSGWVMALLIGIAAMPGAFIARRLTQGLSVRAHAGILDGVVVLGGLILIAQGLGLL
jgi:uncharacterized membrane protein YfcA